MAIVVVITLLLFFLEDVYGDVCFDSGVICDGECCGEDDNTYCCEPSYINFPLIIGLTVVGLVVLFMKVLCIWMCIRRAGARRRVIGYARIQTTTATAPSNQAGSGHGGGSASQGYPPLLSGPGTLTFIHPGYQEIRPLSQEPNRFNTNPPPPRIYNALANR